MIWCLLALPGLAWIVAPVVLALAARKEVRLADCPTDGPEALPRLSIVVPALNEESTIEPAISTLLALDYPNCEVIAVDDRSTDRTAGILDSLVTQHPRLTVIHVTELPPGWLGKNHALHAGAAAATGDWILFTDADVHFAPDVMRRAVRYAIGKRLDHLVTFPELVMRGFWEMLHSSHFAVVFTLYSKPWQAADPRKRGFIGVGAFNLVRASKYRSIGGHESLKMDVADDMKLGKKIKQSGGRQAYVIGGELVKVRWFIGFRGALESLTKNAFAGQSFKPVAVMGSVAGLFIATVWPAIGLLIGPPAARILCGCALAGMAATPGRIHIAPRANPLIGLCYPLGAVLFIWILLRSMILAYRQGGIIWRGTLYPLEELRRGIV